MVRPSELVPPIESPTAAVFHVPTPQLPKGEIQGQHVEAKGTLQDGFKANPKRTQAIFEACPILRQTNADPVLTSLFFGSPLCRKLGS